MAECRARAANRDPRLQILLVAHVGHGALVVGTGWRGERILATGDHVVGANCELAAPGGAPGQTEAETLPLTGLTGNIDHATDNVGAEGAVAAANTEALGIPAIGQCREVRGGDEACAGNRATDGDYAFATDVLLAEDGEVLLFHTRLATGTEPGGQGVV